jgi:hypothetical protein
MKNFSEFLTEASVSRSVVQAKALGLTNIGPDGRSHGDWYKVYPDGTKEFTAKTSGKKLVFYNQGQIPGRKDPNQVRTQANQQPVATQVTSRKEEFFINHNKDLREKYIAGEIFNEGDVVESLINGLVGKIIRRGTNHLICVTKDDEMFKSWITDVKESNDVEVPSKNLKKLVNKAVKRHDSNIDGFVDKSDKNVGPYGAFIPQSKNVPNKFKEEYQEKSVPGKMRSPGKPNTLVGTDGYRKLAMDAIGMDTILNFNIDGKKFINKYRKK